MLRENVLHWEWMVYLEMFIAGIAAGAYFMAAILEVLGRGKSPVARTAHAIAWPLMLAAGLLLIFDLNRPERFWHMNVQAKTGLPMLKLWSPMSFGSWSLLGFELFTFVSFVDVLIGRGLFSIGGWRRGRTLHGSALGLIWAMAGGGIALAVAGYSGVLLTVTNFPGWSDSVVIGALYVSTAMVTGMAALLLIQVLRGNSEHEDVQGLARANFALTIWWMLVMVLFLSTLGRGYEVFMTGPTQLAIIGAAIVGGIVPPLLRFGSRSAPPTITGVAAALILVGGFLLRYGVVMGPQSGI